MFKASDGRAIFASGSPFPDVVLGENTQGSFACASWTSVRSRHLSAFQLLVLRLSADVMDVPPKPSFRGRPYAFSYVTSLSFQLLDLRLAGDVMNVPPEPNF